MATKTPSMTNSDSYVFVRFHVAVDAAALHRDLRQRLASSASSWPGRRCRRDFGAPPSVMSTQKTLFDAAGIRTLDLVQRDGRRAFMVRTMASAEVNRGGRAWSREGENFEREGERVVGPLTLQCPPVPAHFRTIRCKSLLSTVSQLETQFAFLQGDPKIQKSASAQAVRGCAARVWTFGTSHSHESNGSS